MDYPALYTRVPKRVGRKCLLPKSWKVSILKKLPPKFFQAVLLLDQFPTFCGACGIPGSRAPLIKPERLYLLLPQPDLWSGGSFRRVLLWLSSLNISVFSLN
ncbi:hypothetical protein NMG60_11036486 [Bertholletia excelsa]